MGWLQGRGKQSTTNYKYLLEAAEFVGLALEDPAFATVACHARLKVAPRNGDVRGWWSVSHRYFCEFKGRPLPAEVIRQWRVPTPR